LATLTYFFARASETWLIPLREEDFFTSPPEPVVNEEEGTAQIPFWPQSQFLLRVAPGSAAEAVATVLGIRDPRARAPFCSRGSSRPWAAASGFWSRSTPRGSRLA